MGVKKAWGLAERFLDLLQKRQIVNKLHGTLQATVNEFLFWIPAPATAAQLIACTGVGTVGIAAGLQFEEQ